MTCLKVGLSSPAFFVEVYELILMEIIMVTFAEKNNAVFFGSLSNSVDEEILGRD